MEQLYLVEIMLDKVSIFVDENETSTASKNLICIVKFGPKLDLVVKEDGEGRKDDTMFCDEQGNRKFTRILRQGKSVLFASYPDIMLQVLKNFPLAIEVFNDDANEGYNIYVGVGYMTWDSIFFAFLKETANVNELHEPLAVKTSAILTADSGGKACGEISFIVRISALGARVVTEFLELDPNDFIFATDKSATRFSCYRRKGDDPNFTMVGSLYETVTLEDPDVVKGAIKKIQICTELQNCGLREPDARCSFQVEQVPEKYSIENIRMGDIRGPCGNPNCQLAHQVKAYIRNLETYKKASNDQSKSPKEGKKGSKEENKESKEGNKGSKEIGRRNDCGSCICEDETWHREGCPDKSKIEEGLCKECGAPKPGNKCEKTSVEQCPKSLPQQASATNSPSPSLSEQGKKEKGDKTVNYMVYETRDQELLESLFGKDFTTRNLTVNYDFETSCSQDEEPRDPESFKSKLGKNLIVQNVSVIYDFEDSCNQGQQQSKCCLTKLHKASLASNRVFNENVDFGHKNTSHSFNQEDTLVYSADIRHNTSDYKSHQISSHPSSHYQTIAVYNCLTVPDDKDCKCDPPKPKPPCKSADCECIHKLISENLRKLHKPFCPSYKHKTNCPVTIGEKDETKTKKDDEEDEPEPLPYGLPPIKLGPCPVIGRPCSVPDGFARMYKIAAIPPQPTSYSTAGKVCCSKEFERIKNAIKEFMKREKEPDYRCINKFNVDTEKRCCDKQDVLKSLMGKDCCGSHKMAIQERYKHEK